MPERSITSEKARFSAKIQGAHIGAGDRSLCNYREAESLELGKLSPEYESLELGILSPE